MRILMCPPTEYRIAWEINPWMDIKHQPDPQKAGLQWHRIFEIYQKLGIRVHLIKPVQGLSDMIFTANAGWGRKGTFILSRFRYPERRGEQLYFKSWLHHRGFKTIQLPANVYFEGQADLVTTKEAYLFGWGIRSSLRAKQCLKHYLKLQKEIISLRLVDEKFYHLDTCLMYLQPIDAILYYPGAFDKASRAKLNKLGAEKIEITRKEAKQFICNGVYYEDTIILCGANARITKMLRKRGLEVISVDVSEFKKSGAGARCLTFFLD